MKMMEMRVGYENDLWKARITHYGYLGLKHFTYNKNNKLLDAFDEAHLFKKHKYGLESLEIIRDMRILHQINTFYYDENDKLVEAAWYSGSVLSLGHNVGMFYFPKNLDGTLDMKQVCWANQFRYHEYPDNNTVLVRFPVIVPIDRNIQLVAQDLLTGNYILTKTFIIMNPELFKTIYEEEKLYEVASIEIDKIDKEKFFKLYEDMYNKIYNTIEGA